MRAAHKSEDNTGYFLRFRSGRLWNVIRSFAAICTVITMAQGRICDVSPTVSTAAFTYSTQNLGDEVQTLAASQFLPTPPIRLNRDWVGAVRAPQGTRLIANGWYSWLHQSLELPPEIWPFYVAVHIQPGTLTEHSRRQLLRFSPIGCRDLTTLQMLQQARVPAYFSGCLTMTLARPDVPKQDHVLLHDVDDDFLECIPKFLREGAHTSTQYSEDTLWDIGDGSSNTKRALKVLNYLGRAETGPKRSIGRLLYSALSSWPAVTNVQRAEQRLKSAQTLLNEFASARLVITSKLHCAMPCVAMGTPVVMLHPDLDDPRFAGLTKVLGIRNPLQTSDAANWNPEPRDIRLWADYLKAMCHFAMSTGRHPFLSDDSGLSEEGLASAQQSVLESIRSG